MVFSYYISKEQINIPELPQHRRFGDFNIAFDAVTPFYMAEKENFSAAVFGFAIDLFTGCGGDLTGDILDKCSDISDLLEFEKKIGGKYLILFRIDKQYYLLGDATCSIPVYYTSEGEAVCTSNPEFLVKRFGFQPDPLLNHIRQSGDISQAMPFDITHYREIMSLLPNHILNICQQAASRFINSDCPQKKLTVKEATDKALPLIQTLSDFYSGIYRIYCPITGGRDSRVVMSFLNGKTKHKTPSYTIRHKNFRDDDTDLTIPAQLCASVGIPYTQICDEELSESIIGLADHLLGKGCYSQRTLQIAETIRTHYGDGAVINGDIIGQVGKCSLHRDIPSCFATPAYFRCKLHNYSDEAKKQLKLWIDEIKDSGEKINVFDLFSIENRMGRWAGQENLVYNSIGQPYLNVFNSRSIIYLWTAVSRKERKTGKIQKALIERVFPELLETPYGTGSSKLNGFAKKTGMTYLAASYIKYYTGKKKFMKNCK